MNNNYDDTNIEMPTLAGPSVVQSVQPQPVITPQPVVVPAPVVEPVQPVVAPQPVVTPAPVVEPVQPVVTPQPVVAPTPVVEPVQPVVAPQPAVNSVDPTVLNNPATANQVNQPASGNKKPLPKAEIIGTVVFVLIGVALLVWCAKSYFMLG